MPVTLAMSAATDCGSRLLLRYCTQKQKKRRRVGYLWVCVYLFHSRLHVPMFSAALALCACLMLILHQISTQVLDVEIYSVAQSAINVNDNNCRVFYIWWSVCISGKQSSGILLYSCCLHYVGTCNEAGSMVIVGHCKFTTTNILYKKDQLLCRTSKWTEQTASIQPFNHLFEAIFPSAKLEGDIATDLTIACLLLGVLKFLIYTPSASLTHH